MKLLRPFFSSGCRGAARRRLRLLWCGVGAAALLVSAAPAVAAQAQAQAPALADVAKKEQQRRKGTKPAQKVYTNKDLPAPAPAPDPAAAPAATQPTPIPAEPAAAQQPEQQKAAGDQKDESFWRNRMLAAREELRRNEVFLEALQSRVNALSADFVNRDDPYQRAKIGEDRQKAVAEMDRVRRDIEQTKNSIENIEEEARKAGVPPGWLR